MEQSNDDIGKTAEETIDPNVKRIKIRVTGYKHFVPVYKTSIIKISAKFLNVELGSTQSHPLLFKEHTPINMNFSLNYNQTLLSDLDNLLSVPVILSEDEIVQNVDVNVPESNVVKEEEEIPGEIDYEDDPDEVALRKALTLQEAYTGIETKREHLLPRKEAKKMKKQREASIKKMKEKKAGGSVKSEAEAAKKEEKPTGPILIGTSSFDLLPFFLGKSEVIESLAVKRSHIFSIDNCASIANTPYIDVKATVDELVTSVEDSNILNLTVEAFYNVPSIMGPEMDYSIAVHVPKTETDEQPLLFKKYEFCTARNLISRKLWYTKPGVDIELPPSTYIVEPHWRGIKNRAKAELEPLIGKEVPRIEYNILKRTLMRDNVLELFEKRLRKYRSILFEIYATPKVDKTQMESTRSKTKSDKSRSKDKNKDKKSQVADETEPFLHLMAFADINSLLHPGVQKCRIACPVQTYHEAEIVNRIGEYNSYFRPKKLQVIDTAPSSPSSKKKKEKAESKKSKKDKSESKKSKKDKSTKSKKSDKSRTNRSNIADSLPTVPMPVVIEPSKFVYDESGKPTFILLDFELINPLVPARMFEDLSDKFYQLIPEYPKHGKQITSFSYSESYFRDSIRQLIEDINKQYRTFREEIEETECPCEHDESSFLSFLHHEGFYKTYFITIQRAVSLMISSKYPELTITSENSTEYQNIVSEVYTYLTNEMNKTVNIMSLCEQERPPVLPIDETVTRLLYAKEACELGAYELAKKYHLQRIQSCDTNPDYWFDYAIYFIEILELEKARECLKQALALNSIHINSLFLFGTLLFEQNKFSSAETFYLLITLHEPNLIEGWSLLYLFYNKTENVDGQDLCKEMIDKYSQEEYNYDNYFFNTDDLAWSAKLVQLLPRTPFFKLATLLIKMRMLQTANLAIAQEIPTKMKFCHYLIGVSLYYNGSYKNAYYHTLQVINHIEFNYASGGLLAHCLLQLKKYNKAMDIYERILQSKDRPDDIHLIYLRAAIAHDRNNNDQYSRKLLLLACKYCPTPYSWLGAGLMYLKQRDMFSAEACLSQANVLDNLLPEIWAYLCLINLSLNRQCEAQMCYRQAIRNELSDPELLRQLENEMNQYRSKITLNMDVNPNQFN